MGKLSNICDKLKKKAGDKCDKDSKEFLEALKELDKTVDEINKKVKSLLP